MLPAFCSRMAREAKRPATPGIPLWSIAELAREFGVSSHKLNGIYNITPADQKPKPVRPAEYHVPARFNPAEMRKWWAARGAK